jgi:hypothetical protein
MLFYLFGMVLFLAVAVGAFLAPPENSLANMTTGDIAVIFLSVAMLVTGRLINWKYGGETSMLAGATVGRGHAPGNQDPNQTRLEQLGYHVPPESAAAGDDGEDGDEDDIEGPVVVCTECGTRNGTDFRFCRECSSELPT